MIYFAKNHGGNYTKLVLENSCRADEHECPFGRASVELVRILCELLKIGKYNLGISIKFGFKSAK